MNKATHVLLGKHLYAYVKETFGILLDRDSFLLGNVLPDVCLNFLIRPHVLNNYSFCIQSRIQKLLGTKQPSVVFDKSYSKQLGIICHYLSDYFCFPHRQDYVGDIVSHVHYERDLYRYLQRAAILQPEALHISDGYSETDEKLIFSCLIKLQENYIKNEPSFENDITYTLKICAEALVRIISTSLQVRTNKYELCYPA